MREIFFAHAPIFPWKVPGDLLPICWKVPASAEWVEGSLCARGIVASQETVLW